MGRLSETTSEKTQLGAPIPQQTHLSKKTVGGPVHTIVEKKLLKVNASRISGVKCWASYFGKEVKNKRDKSKVSAW